MPEKNLDVSVEAGARFAFCVHSHQPAGNSPDVLEKVYGKSYLPFFEKMYEHPGIMLNAHFSGYLLEWLIKMHPEYVDMLKEMVSRGQLEILGGGIYEPILAAVPLDDAVGQIKELNSLVLKTFGTYPGGMWLAERVWEPHLPEVIKQSGLTYTLVDDLGFMNAGIPRESLSGYYTSEFNGSEVAVFPINLEIRDSIPFSGHIKALNNIERASTRNSGKLIVFGDDCEKFGSWPGTYEDVYKKKWLERFLTGLEKRNIETVHFSDYKERESTTGMVYLPTCSYPEMMTWALDPADQKKAESLMKKRGMGKSRLMLGAHWRNFLTKYSESLQLYRKIRFVSGMVQEAGVDHEARMHLYRGEANDAMWHGVFGGIYLPLLRMKSYSSLIHAQKLAEHSLGRVEYFRRFGSDLMRKDSFCISTGGLWVYGGASHGLEVEEIDLKDAALNLTDSLTRREEEYHASIQRILKRGSRKKGNIGKGVFVKDIGDISSLIYDHSPRRSFKDHFIGTGEGIEEHMVSADEDLHLHSTFTEMANEERFWISRSYRANFRNASIGIDKEISVRKKSNQLTAAYRFSGISSEGDTLRLGSEINLSAFSSDFDSITVNGRRIESLKGRAFETSTLALDYHDLNLRVVVDVSGSKLFWVYPVETISNSEEGLETILQGFCVMPVTELSEGGRFEISIKAMDIPAERRW